MAHPVPPMQSGCPWSELSHAWPPNVKWCEAQVCGWIVEPANTWSNLAYILVGIGLLAYAVPRGRRLLTWFGWAEIIVGATSFIYLLAWNALFQWLDFLGMYVFAGLPLMLNLVRLGHLPRPRLLKVYALAVVGLTALTPVLASIGAPIQLIVLVLVGGILGSEFALRQQAANRSMFWLSLGFMAAAFAFSVSDVTRLRCDPEDHLFQGHAIWHVLGALSLRASAGYYRQFEADLVGGPA